jgi:hypothetical protein
MGFERYFKNINDVVVKLFVLGTLILSGCSSYCGVNKDSDFDSKGLPNHKYLVGGGYDIHWIAPTDGTAYLVMETIFKRNYPKRLIMTRAYKSGEDFQFSSKDISNDDIKKYFAEEIHMSALRFSLYFIPYVKSQTEPASK